MRVIFRLERAGADHQKHPAVVPGTGIEPARSLCTMRWIFVTLQFSMPGNRACLCAGLCLHPGACSTVGARRLVSTRSPEHDPNVDQCQCGASLGVASVTRPGGSPTLTGFTRGLSHPGAQKFFKSTVSTCFTTPAGAWLPSPQAAMRILPRTWRRPSRQNDG